MIDPLNLAIATIVAKQEGWKIVSTPRHKKHGSIVFDVGHPKSVFKYTATGGLRICTPTTDYSGRPKMTNSFCGGTSGEKKMTFNDAIRYLLKRFGKKGGLDDYTNI